jgi:hypothetical protein
MTYEFKPVGGLPEKLKALCALPNGEVDLCIVWEKESLFTSEDKPVFKAAEFEDKGRKIKILGAAGPEDAFLKLFAWQTRGMAIGLL